MLSNCQLENRINSSLQSLYIKFSVKQVFRGREWMICLQFCLISQIKKLKTSTIVSFQHNFLDHFFIIIKSSMYNYQTFRKQQSLHKQIQTIKKEHQHTEIKRESSSPALVHSHKKRIQGFVLSAIDKPIPVNPYKDDPHSFRDSNGQGILGSKGFYLRRESQSQRIENQLKKNESLDHIPFTNTFSHQFRHTQGKGMHYKSLNHNFRIKQFLDRQTLNYLPNSQSKPDKLIKKIKNGQRVNLEKLNTSINKNLLPMLHQKTYFKSVSTLFTEIPSRQERTQGIVSNQEGVDESQQKRVIKPAEHMSRKQNSREALIKCNMLRQKLRG